MLPHNHKRTTSSLAPPIFYVAKKWQLKDRRLSISASSCPLQSLKNKHLNQLSLNFELNAELKTLNYIHSLNLVVIC